MKIEIARYVAKCDTYQRVKVVHLKSARPLQPLSVPSWKWDDISMDFIVGLPKASKGCDFIWVNIDHLTKQAHFLPVITDYLAIRYAKIYIDHIMNLHGVPKQLFQIEVHSLSPNSGKNFINPWVLSLSTV